MTEMAGRYQNRDEGGRFTSKNVQLRCSICGTQRTSQWRRMNDWGPICNAYFHRSWKNALHPDLVYGVWVFVILERRRGTYHLRFQQYTPVVQQNQCRFCAATTQGIQTHCNYCQERGFHLNPGDASDMLDAVARPRDHNGN